MTVETDFENEADEEDLPARLKIALPVWREEFEDYLSERVKEISDELEKSGYAEIEYRYGDEMIRQELSECEHLYEKRRNTGDVGIRFLRVEKDERFRFSSCRLKFLLF